MSKKILSSVMIGVLFSLAACNLIPSSSPTQAALPTGTITSGIPISNGNISLVIPTGLASSASFSNSVDVEYPYINPSFGDMPEHTIITLNGFTLQGKTPRILVFEADQFAQYTEMTQKIITALQVLPVQSSTVVPADLATTFFAQTKILSSSSSNGLRYLTEVLTGFAAINNQDIFYYYQGLSADKKYYMEAIIPINALFLVADTNPSSLVPSDGIPFPFDPLTDVNAIQNYYNQVKEKLDATDLSAFSPSVGLLDELIQSIHFKP